MPKFWNEFFNKISEKDYYISLMNFLDEEYKNHVIYPKKEDLFKAFDLVKPGDVKIVIIGQDPYHEEGQAMGLAFSVPSGTPLPPSLRNIYLEISNEYNSLILDDGDLTYLANQGVLLINAYLTVRAHQPLSHKRKEYEQFMGDLVGYLNSLDQNIVFMLWGNFAQKYEKYLSNKNHLIIENTHPSPLGANKGGWFNENQFKRANKFLTEHNIEPIDWVRK